MSDSATSLHKPAPIAFTGSGSAYFRIWIVNLVLTYLTLGIYSAWAKVRREKFFHQHTVIAGHSFDYHGDPKAIMKGRGIVFGLFALYSMLKVIPFVAVVGILLLAPLLPWLMQRSVRFRIANSSYRGVRFNFRGTAPQAYRLLAPFGVAALLYLPLVWLPELFPQASDAVLNRLPISAEVLQVIIFVVPLVAAVSFFPILLGVWRRFTVNHAHFGSVNAHTEVTAKGYLWIYLGTIGSALVPVLIALGLVGWSTPRDSNSMATFAYLIFVGTAGYIIVQLAYNLVTARLHNYCWNKTAVRTTSGRTLARFTSNLSVARYAGLLVKNWLLMLLTLGLYWPFAKVALTKARLESILLSDERFIEFVVGDQAAKMSSLGEEAADALDLEFAL